MVGVPDGLGTRCGDGPLGDDALFCVSSAEGRGAKPLRDDAVANATVANLRRAKAGSLRPGPGPQGARGFPRVPGTPGGPGPPGITSKTNKKIMENGENLGGWAPPVLNMYFPVKARTCCLIYAVNRCNLVKHSFTGASTRQC